MPLPEKRRVKTNCAEVKRKKISSVPIFVKKVGKQYGKRKRPFSYHDVEFDENKWADASKYLPIDFDLCHCRVKDHDKTRSGWYTGHQWDGIKIRDTDTVLFWKCNYNF